MMASDPGVGSMNCASRISRARNRYSGVAGNQSSAVGAACSVSVGTGMTTRVGKDMTVTIGGNMLHTISGNSAETVGGNHTTVVDGDIVVSNQGGYFIIKESGDILIGGRSLTIETTGAYTFGEGNPQGGYNAIGNLTPLILSNYRRRSGIRSPIRFGDRNLYDSAAETSARQVPTGNPAKIHADNLTQRSNTRNGQLAAGEGIVALGYNRSSDLLLVLARDNGVASGSTEHEAKSAIEHFNYFGCTDAVAFDVSTSCTMRTQAQYYATPDSRKDNAIEVGFKIGPR